MITIISASNRKGNLTSYFSNYCKSFFEQNSVEYNYFSLHDLPDQISLASVYEYEYSHFSRLAKEYILPASKLLFLIPEYNGSIPGILKLWLDGTHPEYFKGKKAALIGLSAGRAGNLRGMDHFTDILHYLQVNVMPQKLPISGMNDFLKEGVLVDQVTSQLIDEQLNRLIEF